MTSFNNSKIIVDLMGGLGNQLFQFSAGSVLSDKLGGELVLNLQSIKCTHDKVGITELVPKQVKTIQSKNNFVNKLYSKVSSKGINLQRFNYYNRNYHTYIEDLYVKKPSKVLNLKEDKIRLKGYFQSYLIVNEFKKLNLLNFQSANPEILLLIEKIKNESPVVFHIRRGDYLNLSQSFGLLDIEYYENAYEICRVSTKDKILVFTDSESLVSDEFSDSLLNEKVEIVKINEEIPAWHYMVAMSYANKLVNSNSTFSWWSSAISNASHIIAPEHYYRSESFAARNNLEILYPHWEKLQPKWSNKYDRF
jgi:hypothetical protein